MQKVFINDIQRPDSEELILSEMARQIDERNVLEFTKTAVAAISIMGDRLSIQNKVIAGINGMNLEAPHKELIVYVVVKGGNEQLLKRICFGDATLPLIYRYDQRPNLFAGPLHLRALLDIYDEQRVKTFAVDLQGTNRIALMALSNTYTDVEMPNKLVIKVLAQISHFPPLEYASQLATLLTSDAITPKMVWKRVDLDKFGEIERETLIHSGARRDLIKAIGIR